MTVGIIVGLMAMLALQAWRQSATRSQVVELERRVASLKRQLARETRT